MDFSTLKTNFLSYTDESDGVISDSYLALWFNEAQLELALIFGEVGTQAYSASADDENALPSDLMSIIKCVDTENGEIQLFTLTPDAKIIFDVDGTYKLYYRKIPTDFTGTTSTQESALPAPVHHLMALFAAHKYWDQESGGDIEESRQADKFLGLYNRGKNLMENNLTLSNNGITPRSWAIVD